MAATDEEIAAYPIDTRVSLDLHPQQVLGMPEYTSETEINFRDTFDAFDAALKAVGKVYDAKAAVEGDPTLNPAAKLLKVDDYASNLLKSVADKMYQAKRYHEEAVRIIEASFAEPLKQRAAHTISVEVRSYVRSMAATPSGKPGDTVSRLGFLMNAIRDSDSDTLAAVLGAPPFLSGITREDQKILQRRWHEVNNAPSYRKLQAHEAGLALMERKGNLVFTAMEKAVGTMTDHAGRKFTPAELRALRDKSAKQFASVGM